MLLDEITTYLANAGIGLTAGTNLFYGFMPPAPDACVAVHEYPGMAIEPELGGTTVRLEYPSIQIVCRSTDDRTDDYIDPRVMADTVMKELTKIGDTDLGSVRYLAVQAKQSPYFLRRDENFRVHIACNYHVVKNPS